MVPERQRVLEDSGEMGETIYDTPPPPKPQAPKPTPTPQVEQVQAATAPARESSTPRPTAVQANKAPKAATVDASSGGDNGTLRMILGAAAALFGLSILAVAILYVMGKI